MAGLRGADPPLPCETLQYLAREALDATVYTVDIFGTVDAPSSVEHSSASGYLGGDAGARLATKRPLDAPSETDSLPAKRARLAGLGDGQEEQVANAWHSPLAEARQLTRLGQTILLQPRPKHPEHVYASFLNDMVDSDYLDAPFPPSDDGSTIGHDPGKKADDQADNWREDAIIDEGYGDEGQLEEVSEERRLVHAHVIKWLESVGSDGPQRCRSEGRVQRSDDGPFQRQSTRSAPPIGRMREAYGSVIVPMPTSPTSGPYHDDADALWTGPSETTGFSRSSGGSEQQSQSSSDHGPYWRYDRTYRRWYHVNADRTVTWAGEEESSSSSSSEG